MAEYRLLNACFLDNKYLDSPGVNEDAFIHEQSKTIYNSMMQLRSEKVPINMNSLFQRAASLDVGIRQDQIALIQDINTESEVVLDDILKTLSSAKKRIISNKDIEEVKDILNSNIIISADDKTKLRDLLYRVEENTLIEETHEGVMNFEQWKDAYFQEFDKRSKGKAYYFNDEILDNLITTGPQPGQGGLICASSGMGKSAYCLNLINRFIDRQIPCMYFSLEMGKVDTADRLMSIRKQIPFKDIINPTSSDPTTFQSIRSLLMKEFDDLIANNKFRFCDEPTLTLNDLRSYITKFQTDTGQKYCLVVIDLLTMIQDFASLKGNASLANQIEFAINKLNAMAKELGFHYIGVVQLNRTVEADKVVDIDDITKLRPTRSAIKNANALLERARYVVSLFRPKYFADTYLSDDPQTAEMQDIIEVGIMKQNNGITTKRYALFDGETFTVTPMLNTEETTDETESNTQGE